MNRREILRNLFGALAVMFVGLRPRFAKASPEAIRLAKNGIISPQRTPWMLGGKVFVDGKEVPSVLMANVSKGFVVYRPNWGKGKPRTLANMQTKRLYGYVHAELPKENAAYRWGSWPESEVA